MGNFNDDREMHDAVCADCNKKCQVPFKPTQGKPVKCSDCFNKDRPSRGGGRFGGNRGGRDRRGGFLLSNQHNWTAGNGKQE